jgi:hypothetical protein
MMTKEEAIAFANEKKYEPMTYRERALLQLKEDLLCMPFDVFHEAIQKALGRPVWTPEFGLNRDGLLAELEGLSPTPSLTDIVNLIPEDKQAIVLVDDRKKE